MRRQSARRFFAFLRRRSALAPSGIARLHDGTIAGADAVNVEDRRTGLSCALLCTALRVAAFDLRCESADFCGKSAPRRFSLPPGGKAGEDLARTAAEARFRFQADMCNRACVGVRPGKRTPDESIDRSVARGLYSAHGLCRSIGGDWPRAADL